MAHQLPPLNSTNSSSGTTKNETNRDRTSSRSSRFKFESDQTASQLTKIEEEARRKRDEFRSRVRAIDDRIAGFTLKLTQEIMDRDAVHADILDRSVHLPLERCLSNSFQQLDLQLGTSLLFQTPSTHKNTKSMSATRPPAPPPPPPPRLQLPKDASGKSLPPPPPPPPALPNNHQDNNPKSLCIPQLDHNISNLKQDLLTFQHKTIYQLENKHLLHLQRILTERMAPQIRLEQTKADKREGSLVRTFEAMAANSQRHAMEQLSLEKTELHLLQQEYERMCQAQQKQTHDFLQQISQIRKMIQQERLERQAQDQIIIDRIIQTQELLQKNVLDSMNRSKSSV